MPQYDLAGNPLPEKNTDQNAPLGGDPPPVQRPLYAQGAQQPAPTRYDMAGNPLPTQNPPAAASPTRYDFAGNPIASAPPATPYYAAPPAAGSTWPPPPNNAAYGRPTFVNTSGTQGDVPPEIARLRWNWGAFLISRWWCYRHGLRTAAIILFASLFVLRRLMESVTGVSSAAIFVVYILADYGIAAYLAVKGHELAWRNRRFDDLDEYFKVQRAWLIGGIAWQVFWNGLILWIAYSASTMSHTP